MDTLRFSTEHTPQQWGLVHSKLIGSLARDALSVASVSDGATNSATLATVLFHR